MSNDTVMAFPDPSASVPVIYDPDVCTGCNKCVNVCQVDLLIPNPEKKRTPLVLYPGECYYCGSCVAACPEPGAIKLTVPLMHRVRWKRKQTGEHFRLE